MNNHEFKVTDESAYKLHFLSWALEVDKNKIISDLLEAFQNSNNLASLLKETCPINFSYVVDRFNDNKKYKVIIYKKEV